MKYQGITKIANSIGISVIEIKHLMVKHKVATFDGGKVVPTDKILEDKIAEEREGQYENGNYYVYNETKLLEKIKKKKEKDDLLLISNYKKASQNIKELYWKLIDESGYFHTFKYEIENAVKKLLENMHNFKKVDQKRVLKNIEYLRRSNAYQMRDISDAIYC